ncbi:MAG: hypothetical protein AABW88_02550 [Nanoarchaeota archaeon]
MKINKISLSLVVYLALIESISLFVLDFSRNNLYGAFLVGFIPAIIVLGLYNLISNIFPVKLNNKSVSKIPAVLLSVANGLFIVTLFFVQDIMTKINPNIVVPLFGFFSVFFVFLVLVLIYNNIKLNVIFNLGKERIEVKQISLYFAIYAGIVEAFILPFMYVFYSINIPSLLNGLFAGLIGGIIGLFLVNLVLRKIPLELL